MGVGMRDTLWVLQDVRHFLEQDAVLSLNLRISLCKHTSVTIFEQSILRSHFQVCSATRRGQLLTLLEDKGETYLRASSSS